MQESLALRSNLSVSTAEADSRGRESGGAPSASGDLYEVGEFWTARQRQAARIHEISYRACFKPQLPEYFIERYSKRGDVVYDPFMGRGTTPIQAALMGRVPYGNDVNPLSAALAEPRVNPPRIDKIAMRLKKIPFDDFAKARVNRNDLLTFYHPRTLAQIEGLRRWFRERVPDKIDRWIRMVVINRLTGHSPGFLSVYTMPPNQAVTVERQAIINERRNQKPPYRDVKSIILRKSASLLSRPARTSGEDLFPSECPGEIAPIRDEDCLFLTRRSDSTTEVIPGGQDVPNEENIPDGSVSLTVTSPPFLDVVNYEQDNWLRCWFLGVDPKSVQITRHRKIEDWEHFVHSTFRELQRVTKDGGHVAFEVGEVRNGTIKLEEHVLDCVAGLDFDVKRIFINKQRFTKTSNTWGVTNNARGTNTNRIVLLRRKNRPAGAKNGEHPGHNEQRSG